MANVIAPLAANSSYFEVLSSAARTATPDTFEFEVQGRGYEYKGGLHLIIDVTAIVTTPSITVTVYGVDRVSGQTYVILASAAITAVTGAGTPRVLKIGPGLVAAANLTANDILPPIFRVGVTHANGNSITYSVSGMLV